MTYYKALSILPSLSNFEITKILLTSPIESAATTPAACSNLSSSASNPGVSTISNCSPILVVPTTTYFVTDSPPSLTSSLFEVNLLNSVVFPDPITPKKTTLNPLIILNYPMKSISLIIILL